MTAFKNLPPWSDFQKGQESDMLRMRNAYIEKLWECHRKTLKEHSDMDTPAAEEAAHDEWVRAKAAATSVIPNEPPRMPCPECVKLWN
jgi:hypothetical protein